MSAVEASGRQSADPDATDALAGLCRRYLEAQLAGNRREALRLLVEEGLARGASVLHVQLRVVQEAQREIGRLWEQNLISIAQEHMATAISNVALAHLYDHASRAPATGKRVTIACVEGEQHDFPARLLADALDLGGFAVSYLGANVPLTSLLSLLVNEPPDVLALSATMTFNVPSLRQTVAEVRRLPEPPPIMVGGGACLWSERLAEELGADGTASDAAEAVRVARRLVEARR